ncbi:MAG: hypothetical protein ACE5FG_01805 [Myxococcota bacterium]
MRAILSLLLTILVAGCTFEHMNRDKASRPEQAMGAGAQVMYPGQRGPAMTGRAVPAGTTSSTSSGSSPGQSSGSASGSGSGSGPDVTLLGGTSTEASGSQRTRKMPILGPLTVLFGYPFWIFGKSVEEKAAEQAEEQRRENGRGGSAPRGDEAERERIRLENERMASELQERARAPEPSATPIAPVGSISDEVAALERRLGGSSGASPRANPLPAAGFGAPRETADRDGDGQPDLWAYYDGSRLVREVLDDDHDGRADRVLHYEDGSVLVRSEEDLDHDGRMEAVSIFRDGELVRKRVDSDGNGESDQWSFFSGGDLIRQELDRNGDGFRDLVLSYEAGQLAREEEDRNGDGRPDLVARYRNGELAERHEDLDYDGRPDVASYYEGGKLTRRELDSNVSLESWSAGGIR